MYISCKTSGELAKYVLSQDGNVNRVPCAYESGDVRTIKKHNICVHVVKGNVSSCVITIPLLDIKKVNSFFN